MASSSPKLQLAPLSIPPHICNFGRNIIGIFSFPLLFSESAVFLYLYDFVWLLITYLDFCCPHGFSDKALHFIFLYIKVYIIYNSSLCLFLAFVLVWFSLTLTYQNSCCPHSFSDKALHFIFLYIKVYIIGCFTLHLFFNWATPY